MNRQNLFFLLFFLLSVSSTQLSFGQCTSMPTTRSELDACNFDIALRFAPRHVQLIDHNGSHSLGGKSDYITAIDYDGDWICHNNWENLNENSNLQYRAQVYYSVVWTKTHWYIIYAYYHPRDWSDSFWEQEHENDLEGILVIVRRDGANVINLSNSVLEGGITVFHTDFYSYKTSGSSLTEDQEDIDGTLQTFDGTHPMTMQEREGHGCKAFPYITQSANGAVTYVHNAANLSEFPSSIHDDDVKYRLVDILEDGGMWSRRNDWDTFVDPDRFNGDTEADHKANPPWAWDDSNDGPTYKGEFALDPVNLVDHYFNSSNTISDCYQFQPYRCAYSVKASKSTICNNREVVFTLSREDNLPLNATVSGWVYDPSRWECTAGCSEDGPSITLRAKGNPSNASSVGVIFNTIECGHLSTSVTILPGDHCAVPAFHIENAVGFPASSFCPGSPIYMDGNASENESSYLIEAFRRPIGSTDDFGFYASAGWTPGEIGTLHLQSVFAADELSPGYEYEIRLTVINGSTGLTTTSKKFTILTSCCKKPINLAYSCKQGRITWGLSSTGGTPVSYTIQVSYGDPRYCGLPSDITYSYVWTTTNQYFDLPFINSYNCFSYKVGADCGDGYLSWSDKTCGGCKKKELKTLAPEEEEVPLVTQAPQIVSKVYPNPSNGVLNLLLKSDQAINVTVEAYDLEGRLIKQLPRRTIVDGQFEGQMNLDANLPRGLYLIVFKTNLGVFHQKVILQ